MKIRLKIYLYFILSWTVITPVIAQSIYINEIMSSNQSTISDEDGDFSDWLEFFNRSDSSVNLQDYGLSDNQDSLFKWIFPEVILEPNEHQLIFASGKDKSDWVKHWETIVNWGDEWKYKLGNSEPPFEWNTLEFDDSEWLAGPSGLGYGDDDDSTIIAPTISLYIRKIFTIEALDDIVRTCMHVDFDDAFVAYINGIEVARENIGTPGVRPPYFQNADEGHEAIIYQGGIPEKIQIDSFSTYLNTGPNVLAIQVHNYGSNSSDMTIIPFLTLGMKHIPPSPVGVPDIIKSSFEYLHTNFSINNSGEEIFLVNPLGEIVDEINTGFLPHDISKGRQPDGGVEWYFFNVPTPGTSNITTGFINISGSPNFSHPGGFYNNLIVISLSSASLGATIYYTIDSSDPVDTSSEYTEPIVILNTTVLKARVIESGYLPSSIETQTYFIDVESDLPVISLSTPPQNLWDDEIGIYALGPNAEPQFPYFGANFWQDWERPIHLEFFETDGNKAFSIDAGVKIFGGWSRGYPQKSLSIFARGSYGTNEINYPIFPDEDITAYKSIVLRNSGNDWISTMFRDGMMQSLVNKIDIDKQAFRPSIVFLNGEYWGIHNIREKVNEDYIASHHEVLANNIDLLENFAEVIEGDNEHYLELIDFIQTNSLVINSNYEYVKTKMDVDNFINYNIAQIYFNNDDWPGNNIKYWRPKTPNGKWRWILFDTDFGFGLFNPNGYSNNTLQFATEPNGPPWPNPPWSTFLLRKLLENTNFKVNFINRFADLSNTLFRTSTVNQKINEIKFGLINEILNHIDRWNWFSLNQWNDNIQVLHTFANYRIGFVRSHFMQKFNLPGTSLVTVDISDTSAGRVRINSLELTDYPWYGHYFNSIPIKLTAHPLPGYHFVRWEGSEDSISQSIMITVQDNFNITAVFEPGTITSSSIVINEINYNSALEFDPGDWIEIFNNSGENIDLSGWMFKDEDDSHVFEFPSQINLAAGEYLVLCNNSASFINLFPNVSNYIGNFNFGLNGAGELIRLFDSDMILIDSLTYDDNPPWPVEPDGNGPTLELLNPGRDNALPANWASSVEHGTPGEINGVFTALDNKSYSQIPTEYSLSQNFPNPFNPETIIKFSLPKEGEVRIDVFNVLGERVIELIDQSLSAGYHEVIFNANNLSSGIYFYRISVNHLPTGKAGFIDTRKMLVLK